MTENKREEGNYPEIPDSSKMSNGKDEIYADLPDFHGKILMYTSEDDTTRVETVFADENIWMSQSGMSELYQVNVRTVNEHIGNIFEDGELDRTVIQSFCVSRKEGSRFVVRPIAYYNLRMILAVGYRVRNHRGAHFRNWASSVLSEYMQKGFALDDRRLKNPKEFGADYFDELLERIRDIRSSEKRLYSKVLDIYALSVDYDSSTEISREFFATVQNKLHYAVTGKTAAEIRYDRIDGEHDYCGLMTWDGDVPRKKDLDVAKNFLTREELENLNVTVSAFLELAEMRARNRVPTYMSDWVKTLDNLLQMGGREVLHDKGSISKKIADLKAEEEYAKYSRRILSAPSRGEKDYMKFLEKDVIRITSVKKDNQDHSDAPSQDEYR